MSLTLTPTARTPTVPQTTKPSRDRTDHIGGEPIWQSVRDCESLGIIADAPQRRDWTIAFLRHHKRIIRGAVDQRPRAKVTALVGGASGRRAAHHERSAVA